LSHPPAIPGHPEFYTERDIERFQEQLGGPKKWPQPEWPRRLFKVEVEDGVIIATFETSIPQSEDECNALKHFAQIPVRPNRKPTKSECDRFYEAKLPP